MAGSGLPVPSSQIVDIKANAENFDTFLNSNDSTFTNRESPNGNVTTKTLSERLKELGYLPPVTYGAGIQFTEQNKTKTISRPDDGNPTASIQYAPHPTALPFTTSGTWGTPGSGDDLDKFFLVQGLTTSSLSTYTDLVFDSVADMVAGNPVPILVGQKASTGVTRWKILPNSSSRGVLLDNGNKAIPLNGLWGRDAGVTYDGVTDDTTAMNLLYGYAHELRITIPRNTSVGDGRVFNDLKPVVKHSEGKVLLTSTVITKGGVKTSGSRTYVFSNTLDFPLFTSSMYETEWEGMIFDGGSHHILFGDTARLESGVTHIHDCICRIAGEYCFADDITSYPGVTDYPAQVVIDNVKNTCASFSSFHNNGTRISNCWHSWDTDFTGMSDNPLYDGGSPLTLTNITGVPFGSNPNGTPTIRTFPITPKRDFVVDCRSVRFGGEATNTPIVEVNGALDRAVDLSFTGCSFFGLSGAYWLEVNGAMPRSITIKNAVGTDAGNNGGGFAGCLGMRVRESFNPYLSNFSTLLDMDDTVPAVARRLIKTDTRNTGSIPTGAVPANYLFTKPQENYNLKLINEDVGNGFTLDGGDYTQTGGAAPSGTQDFLNYNFRKYRFENPTESVRTNTSNLTPSQGEGVYTCAVWVISLNGAGTYTAGYTGGGGPLLETRQGLIEPGLNRIVWQVYYNGVNSIQSWFNVTSSASLNFTEMLLGGVTINRGDTVGAFVPRHTGAVDGVREESFGTAPPTDGKWIEGSYRHNTDVGSSLDGNGFYLKGWICTTGGTPGTWQPEWARNAKWTP